MRTQASSRWKDSDGNCSSNSRFASCHPRSITHSLSDILRLVFWKGDDWRWLEGVPLETWEELLGALAHRDGADQIDTRT